MSIYDKKELKILQIITAVLGWKAVHCRELENGQVEIFNRTVICWALVELIDADHAVRTEVRGVEQGARELTLVGDLRDIEGNQYFLGYSDPETHKESDYWIDQANVRLEMENETRAPGAGPFAPPPNGVLFPSEGI